MNLKRNVFSLLTWGGYLLFVGVGLVGINFIYIDALGYPQEVGFASTLVIFLLCGLLAFGCRKLSLLFLKRDLNVNQKQGILVAESLAVIGLLVGGFLMRIHIMGDVQDPWGYFEIAKVTGDGHVLSSLHGIEYCYLQALHAVFLVFGNKLSAAIWFQIVVQMLTALFFYLAVRRIGGRIAAMVSVAFLMFASVFLDQTLSLNVEVLWLLVYSIGLLACGAVMEGAPVWWGALLTGLYIGFAGYMDILGFTLLIVLGLGILMQKAGEKAILERIYTLLCAVLGAAIGFLGMEGLDAFLSGSYPEKIFSAWWSLYRPEGMGAFFSAYLPSTALEISVLLLLMALGVFSFWFGNQVERSTPWVMSLFCVILLGLFGMLTETVDGYSETYLICSILAGISLTQFFQPKEKKTEEESKVEEAKEPQSDEEPKPKVGYIENPLPLPKKHVKKTLDYDLLVDEGEDFDLSVSENDDYDLK